MKGLILAGGPGSGLRPLTLNTPKPILPIANRPIVLYQIDLLKSSGINEILLSLSYQPRKIEDLLKDGADFGVLVRYASEKTAMGPARAFANAREWVDGPTVILGAGVLTNVDLTRALEFHREHKAAATFVLPDAEITRLAIECDDDGRVVRMAGGAVALGGTGISILAPEILEQIPAVPPIEIDHDLVGTLFRGGLPVFVQRARGYWMHIDSPAKYLQVHRDILGGNLSLERFPMAAAFADGPRAGEGSLIAPGVTVHDGARVEGSVIGPNCTVAAGAELVDSVLWSGNAIGEYARISGSVLGRGCFVGASVILPRGTVLGGKSSITEYSRFSPA